MDNKKEEGPAKPRSRYVWDPNKLAWVETAEEPTVQETPVETTRQEGFEESFAESIPIEAGVEEEELVYRSPFMRLAAFVIDAIVLAIIASVISAAITIEAGVGRYLTPIIGIVYFAGFWTWRGQTPGKIITSAKVVRIDGSPIGIGRALLRFLGYFVYFSIYSYGAAYVHEALAFVILFVFFLIIVFNNRRRGLHDVIAGTVVIDTRHRAPIYYAAEEEPDEAEQEPDSEQT